MRKATSAVLALVCALVCLSTVFVEPGTAAARKRLTLDRPQVTATHVVFTGTARPDAEVRLQRLVAGEWRPVKATVSGADGGYRMRARRADRPARYRAVGFGRRSTVRIVQPASDACGPRLRKPGGGLWSCTLVEEFDAGYDPASWTALTQPGKAGEACNIDDPRTIAVADGTLRLTLRPTDPEAGLVCPARPDGTRAAYASASLSTYWKFSQQYGRFEARIRNEPTDAPGLHEAFWLWPDTRYHNTLNWPLSGEIDIVETYSNYPHLALPFLHYSLLGPVTGVTTTWSAEATRGAWHVYALEWDADQVRLYVDDELVLSNSAGAATFRKRFIVSLTQLLGTGDNAPTARTPVPATMEVDYVRVWQ